MTERDDLIHQIRNRCDIYLALIERPGDYERLVPTIMEDICEDAQKLVLSHSVKE